MKNKKHIYPPPAEPDATGYPRRYIATTPAPYRLARTDPRNITLQRQDPGGRWRNVAYCGNSPRAVTRAVIELAAKYWTPDESQDLAGHVDGLRRAIERLESSINHIALLKNLGLKRRKQ